MHRTHAEVFDSRAVLAPTSTHTFRYECFFEPTLSSNTTSFIYAHAHNLPFTEESQSQSRACLKGPKAVRSPYKQLKNTARAHYL